MDSPLKKKEIHIYTAFTQRAVPGIKGDWQELNQKAALLISLSYQHCLLPKQLEIEGEKSYMWEPRGKQSLEG